MCTYVYMYETSSLEYWFVHMEIRAREHCMALAIGLVSLLVTGVEPHVSQRNIDDRVVTHIPACGV